MKFSTTVNINGLKNAPSVFARHMNQAAKKIEGKLIADAKRQTPEDQGDAKAGFKGFHVVSGFRALIEIRNDTPHFIFIVSGRKAGKKAPPTYEGTPFYNWVVRKFGTENLKSTLFLVAQKIKRDGIPAKPIMENVLNSNKQFIQNTAQDAVNRGVREVNG